ncbi:hypothetical protein [Corynebacterium provencense]|uniref:hypothetical protein n=1 Tax=Corynebacterium provencense TaxID=1737425 RepID=UPI000D7BFED1|nr:hypothetical protein [Corynebacterium provencense]
MTVPEGTDFTCWRLALGASALPVFVLVVPVLLVPVVFVDPVVEDPPEPAGRWVLEEGFDEELVVWDVVLLEVEPPGAVVLGADVLGSVVAGADALDSVVAGADALDSVGSGSSTGRSSPGVTGHVAELMEA